MSERKQFNLEPKNSRQKSFYGKAVVTEYPSSETGEELITLYSYDTPVAAIVKNRKAIFYGGWYSATTARHIQEFAEQHGFKCGGKAWLNEREGKYCDADGDILAEV